MLEKTPEKRNTLRTKAVAGDPGAAQAIEPEGAVVVTKLAPGYQEVGGIHISDRQGQMVRSLARPS